MSTVENHRSATVGADADAPRGNLVKTLVAPRSDAAGGILWATLAMAMFSGLAAASRYCMSLGYHPLEVAFLRFLSALILMLPLLYVRGFSLLKSKAPELYAVRALVSLFSMTSWFLAISLIPLGELTAIGFLSPLFGTLSAVLFLGEKVRARRITALAIGFVGAMIMLRPGMSSLHWGQGFALFSALSGGLMAVLLKQLAGRDDPTKIVFLTTLIMTPLALIPALFVWRTPGWELFFPMIVVGLTGLLGHLFLMRAYRAADASLVLTFEFARLPFAVALGYVMFGELIDLWTWIGAAVIFASAVYIARREARLRAEARKKELEEN